MNRQIPVVKGKFPAPVLITSERFLIGKELFRHFGFRLPWGRILRGTDNDHSIIPAGIFTGMCSRSSSREHNAVGLNPDWPFVGFKSTAGFPLKGGFR